MNTAHILTVLAGQWHHFTACGHFPVRWHLALRYLRREYPGMPRGWYARYLASMERWRFGPRSW